MIQLQTGARLDGFDPTQIARIPTPRNALTRRGCAATWQLFGPGGAFRWQMLQAN
jgi:hypothetical protein